MSETATEQPTVPAWLDKNYVEKVFQHITENRLEAIHDYNIELATSKGENYLSTIYLLTVNYSTKNEGGVEPETKSLIIKSRLDSQLMADIEADLNVYSREVQVYSVLMQEFNSLLRKIGDETEIGPRALYLDERIIVLENLKSKGYCIEDVKRGLNFEQCSVILQKLAKFHALSMVLYKKSPDLFRQHLPANITEHPSPLHEMYKNTVRTTIEYCKTQPALAEYVPKLTAFGDIIIPKMINVFSRNQADRYHVLNHGDVWVNNMMFKKSDDGSIQDVLFVDYQEGFFGSPGIDFNFFIFSSWQTDVLENHYTELLEIYHKNLIEILHAHNYEQRIPTIRDVEKEIINKSLHGLATATCLLPLLINEYPELTDPTHFLFDNEESNANRKKIIDNPAFGKRLEVFFKFFKDNGVL